MSNNLILTGYPGVGKTTLIKKIVNYLQSKHIEVTGFYTEEVRKDTKNRIGFDVITLEGKQGVLARTKEHTNEESKHYVGQYLVFPDQLESLVLPLFQVPAKVIVIDEIGKMELFSDKFKTEVTNLFKSKSKLVIATIPVKKGYPIKFVEDIRENPQNDVIMVNRENRNKLFNEIITKLRY
nr:cancer-related nucleoside-triphosphatase homolog [Onthophagus taurus]